MLAYLLLPEIFFYGLAGIFAAILNIRGHFAAPMWTPILNNLVVIATAGVFFSAARSRGRSTRRRHPRPGPGARHRHHARHRRAGARALAGTAPDRLPLEVAVGLPQAHLRELARLGAWMLLYVGVNQVGITVVLSSPSCVGQQGERRRRPSSTTPS